MAKAATRQELLDALIDMTSLAPHALDYCGGPESQAEVKDQIYNAEQLIKRTQQYNARKQKRERRTLNAKKTKT